MATSETTVGAPLPPSDARFDLIVLVTSAGGLDAVSAVLRALPNGFAAPVVVAQHLSGTGSTLVGILQRRSPLPVTWVRQGMPLRPGRVYVCPPRTALEILPDATCAIKATDVLPTQRPFDELLESVADSFGDRALVVVLTGMGRDGANGALAVKRAGGTVIAQSEDTAEQPSMPRAAVEVGAAELVLPLYEIGRVVAEVVAGGPLPRPHKEIVAAQSLFAGPGEVARLMRDIDWSQTALGPVRDWPPVLRNALRLVLDSPTAMLVLWGPDNIQLYNDHYRALIGAKHPEALAQSSRECWPEAWHINEPNFRRALQGEAVAFKDALIPLSRDARLEDSWFDLGYSPLRDEDGNVRGILATVFESTQRVLAARRLRTLHALATSHAGSTSPREAFQAALGVLARKAVDDIPLALGYLIDDKATRAQLVGSAGAEPGGPVAPHTVQLEGGHPAWPLARVIASGEPVQVDDLRARFRGVQADERHPPESAVLLPLRAASDRGPPGVLIVGLNPGLRFDDIYRTFLDLVAAQIGSSIEEAGLRQKERERSERLAALDRAKTEFFSNVSHEFRTPLTLLLAPLEQLQGMGEVLPDLLREELRVAASNARRLLNLVNTLLDFSQAEAGRLRAQLEPVDLSAQTADIASVFRSAAQRAGIALTIDCPPLDEPVWIDRGMWEKIVSNLLANALKFTMEGRITVRLRRRAQHAELTVADTGIGIPEAEQPHVFKRFHRVRGAKARTQEGAGIGLALVQELVRRHHGRVRVESTEGRGTTFTVWIPYGQRPPAVQRASDAAGVPAVASTLAEVAERWTTEVALAPDSVLEDPLGEPGEGSATARSLGARIVVAEDNADMRDYLRRLLGRHWEVETASDGEEALERARAFKPDLIVADVMMPTLDGFGLLRQLREDKELEATPVILVTARAGEDAAVEGLLAGADDYVGKPFSSRELVARVSAQIALSRMRRKTEERQAYLLKLSDALRPLADPKEIKAAASRVLGEQLRANRVVYAEVEREGWFAVGGYEDGVTPMPSGPYSADVYGRRVVETYRAGGRMVFRDSTSDSGLTPNERQSLGAMDVIGAVGVPLLKEGELVAVLTVQTVEPRDWTEDEIALVEETAERTWAAVERTRAEKALRESEAQLARELAAMRRLHDLHARIATETDLKVALDEILAAACDFTGTDRGCVQLVSDGGERLEMFTWRGYDGATSPFINHFRHEGFAEGCDVARGERRRLIIEDMRTFPGLVGTPDGAAALAVGILAAQSTPMVSRTGETLGVLSTHFERPHRPSDDQLRLVDLLAWAAADFVERHHAQAALQASEARLKRMVNIEGVGILTFDETGTLVEANDAFLAMTGYSRDAIEARALSWRTMTPPEYVAASEAQLEVLAHTGHIGPCEKEYLLADGSRSWMLFAGAALGDGTIIEYCIDVSDRHRSEAARRESERTHRTPVDMRADAAVRGSVEQPRRND